MQNLRKLSILTIAIICTNYFSTMAQEERKAFEEGDKVISIGVSNGINNIISTGINTGFYRPAFTPSVTFDYGLKGTRGLLSIGGFASFSTNRISYGSNTYSYNGYSISPEGYYYTSKMDEFKSATFTTGIRLGLHYSTRKWDLYGGLMVGTRITTGNGGTLSTEYYKGTPQNPFEQLIKTEISNPFSKTTTTDIFISPYAGARYYVTKKVSLNLEVGQYTGNVGLGFKF
jgi:hypothetical protein